MATRSIRNWFPGVWLARHAIHVAVRIYGPFGLRTVPLALGVEVAEHSAAAPYLYWVDAADIVVDRLRTWTALVAVGLVGLAVELTLVVHWRRRGWPNGWPRRRRRACT